MRFLLFLFHRMISRYFVFSHNIFFLICSVFLKIFEFNHRIFIKKDLEVNIGRKHFNIIRCSKSHSFFMCCTFLSDTCSIASDILKKIYELYLYEKIVNLILEEISSSRLGLNKINVD